jgi:hypothetical protein
MKSRSICHLYTPLALILLSEKKNYIMGISITLREQTYLLR